MRVALITEGTYPFVHGGVSVWCDHLIRRLPDVEFDVYAIAATATMGSAWALPPNVTSFEVIGLEVLGSRPFRSYAKEAREDFLSVLDGLIEATLLPAPPDETDFLHALRSLYEAGQRVPVDIGLRSSEAFDLVRSRWRTHQVRDRHDRLGPPTLFDVLEVTSALARFLRPLQVAPVADVAHTTANGLGSLVALASSWEWDTPTLLTEHGVYIRERYLESMAVPQPKRVGAFQLAFFRHLNRAMLQAADAVSPVSDFNRRWELSTGGDSGRIRTIHNGVDPDTFPAVIGEPPIPTISWIGRVDPLKDLVTLIEAFALVRSAVPNARLRLFGPIPVGNESYHQECLEVMGRHGVEDGVSFEGHTSRVSDAHQAGHVVVLSSISEGFPFTVLEAMMSGRATVSTDVGGVAEAVGDTGLLVRPRDPAGLAEALITVLTDHEQRHRLGRAARERALSKFTLDRMTGLYRQVYESLAVHRSIEPVPLSEDEPLSASSTTSTAQTVGGRS